jgi:hypothetical protein
MSRLIMSVLLPLSIAPSLIAAQTRSSMVQGQRVRVVSRCELAGDAVARCPAPGMSWANTWTYSGQLDALDGDTLRIRVRANQAALAIPTASIDRLTYKDGTKHHALQGAGLGLLGGALLGGVIGSTMEWCLLNSCGPATGLGIVVGAPAGLLFGSIIGALIRSDRWRTAPVKAHRIRVAPRLDALGFSVGMTL